MADRLTYRNGDTTNTVIFGKTYHWWTDDDGRLTLRPVLKLHPLRKPDTPFTAALVHHAMQRLRAR